MENITISQEEFEAKKVLAEIGQEIARGRAELEQLRDKKEDFFAKQEEELMQRVQLLLKNSQQSLKLVDKSHDELEKYARLVTDYANELKSWREKLEQDEKQFIETSKTTYDDIDKKLADITIKTNEIEKVMAIIEADKGQLIKQEDIIKNKQRHIASQQASLTNAFEELRKRNG